MIIENECRQLIWCLYRYVGYLINIKAACYLVCHHHQDWRTRLNENGERDILNRDDGHIYK